MCLTGLTASYRRLVLAGAYEKLDDIDRAQEYYLLSLELDPTDEECLTSYVKMLTKISLIDSFDILEEFIVNNEDVKIAKVLKVNLLWKLGRKSEALHLFSLCILEDIETAKELFESFPEYKEIKEFNELID